MQRLTQIPGQILGYVSSSGATPTTPHPTGAAYISSSEKPTDGAEYYPSQSRTVSTVRTPEEAWAEEGLAPRACINTMEEECANFSDTGFNDLMPFPKDTIVSVVDGAKAIPTPANFVSFKNSGLSRHMNFILSQRPQESLLERFVQVLISQNVTSIVALDTSYDYFKNFRGTMSIEGCEYNFETVGDSLKGKGMKELQVTIINTQTNNKQVVSILAVNDWVDMAAYSSNQFSCLTQQTKDLEKQATQQDGTVLIHCHAGVGRSGSLALRVWLSHAIDERLITSEEMILPQQVKATKLGKQERGPGFVMKEAQFSHVHEHTLEEYRQRKSANQTQDYAPEQPCQQDEYASSAKRSCYRLRSQEPCTQTHELPSTPVRHRKPRQK